MPESTAAPRWSLPYESPVPGGARAARKVRAARVAAYAVLAAAMLVPVVQFQHGTWKAQRRQHQAERIGPTEDAPKFHKGAIGRWRKAIRQFWRGRNIYGESPQAAPGAPESSPTSVPAEAGSAIRRAPSEDVDESDIRMHPNMLFVVVLLSPLAYLPVEAMAIAFSAMKVGAILAAGLMVVSVANPRGRRMPDWVVGLALAWCFLFIVGDIQHGNTNAFVLGAITLHLWLYRRGRDGLAGAALALAVCLKLTPAIFVLYWLYQRNWRLLAAAAVAGAVFAAGIPLAACMAIAGGAQAGAAHFSELTGTWLRNLIVPGLVKAAWYPIHINQSLSGVLSRYFLSGDGGKMFWNPDDYPDPATAPDGWITLAAMSPSTVRWILRIAQLAIVAAIAWAIGWRKLPRDDGRRGLHYAMVTVGMLVLNQRTWNHHCAVMLLAAPPIWLAIAFGRMSRAARRAALGLVLLAGPLVWLGGTDLAVAAALLTGRSDDTGRLWADYAQAYGPTFWHLALMLAVAMVLARALRRADPAYADERQRL